MQNVEVVLSNGITLTISGIEDVEAYCSETLELLNNHRVFLVNFGGKIVNKALIWAIAPVYQSDDYLEIKLTVGLSVKGDPTKFDAAKVMDDANKEGSNYIYVAGTVIPKVIIEHVMNQ